MTTGGRFEVVITVRLGDALPEAPSKAVMDTRSYTDPEESGWPPTKRVSASCAAVTVKVEFWAWTMLLTVKNPELPAAEPSVKRNCVIPLPSGSVASNQLATAIDCPGNTATTSFFSVSTGGRSKGCGKCM